MGQLRPGDAAPDFKLEDQDANSVALRDFRGRKLVVYWYPKASTPGCTTQSCAVRDALEDFAGLGADVVGISPDVPAANKRFDEKHGLGFPLLGDPDHATAEAWGVWGEKNLYGKKFMGIIRSAFVLDETGKILETHYNVSPKDTVPKAIEALQAG